MIFEEQTIMILYWPDGSPVGEYKQKSILAQVGQGSGLACHNSTSDAGYMITHIASGYALPPGKIATETQAKSILETVAKLTDWTQDKDTVTASLTALQKCGIYQMIADSWVGHEEKEEQ